MALELASYDLMPSEVPGFAKGFTAALFATSLCYPLDTVRWVTSMLLSCEQSCHTPEALSQYTSNLYTLSELLPAVHSYRMQLARLVQYALPNSNLHCSACIGYFV